MRQLLLPNGCPSLTVPGDDRRPMNLELSFLTMSVSVQPPGRDRQDVVYHSAHTVYVWKRRLQPQSLGAVVSFDAQFRLELDDQFHPCELEILTGTHGVSRTALPEIESAEFAMMAATLPHLPRVDTTRIHIQQPVTLTTDQRRAKLVARIGDPADPTWYRVADRLWIGLDDFMLAAVCLDIHEGISDRDWYTTGG